MKIKQVRYHVLRDCRTNLTPDMVEAGPNMDRAAFIELTAADGGLARGDHIVEVRVTDSKEEERWSLGGLRCAKNGRLRMDEPLAVNARKGGWTITVFDRFTTRKIHASVWVEI